MVGREDLTMILLLPCQHVDFEQDLKLSNALRFSTSYWIVHPWSILDEPN